MSYVVHSFSMSPQFKVQPATSAIITNGNSWLYITIIIIILIRFDFADGIGINPSQTAGEDTHTHTHLALILTVDSHLQQTLS